MRPADDLEPGDDPDRSPAGNQHGSQLGPTVYVALKDLAQRQMRGERPGHTLSATALVHEAYVKLAGSELTGLPRGQFYQAAATAMRRILIDHARRRKAEKRGGARLRIADAQDVVDLAVRGDPDEILALEEAMVRLEEQDPDAAGVVRLRFYAGSSGEEAALALGISPRQADREWAYARAFLLKALGGGSPT